LNKLEGLKSVFDEKIAEMKTELLGFVESEQLLLSQHLKQTENHQK